MDNEHPATDPTREHISTATLEKVRFTIAQIISREFAIDMQLKLSEVLSEDILLILRGAVWGEKIESHDVRWPRDWWQAFKLRWFPKWALRRWPVLYDHEHITVHAVYPNFKPSVRGQTFKIMMGRWSSHDSKYDVGR